MDIGFEIYPNEGIESIKFGMSYTEVRMILRCDFVPSLQKGRWRVKEGRPIINPDFPDRDLFRSIGIIVYYNLLGKCISIRFLGSSHPTLRGRHLLWHEEQGEEYSADYSLESLVLWLDSMGGDCEIHQDFALSRNFGIQLIFFELLDYDAAMLMPPKSVVAGSNEYVSDLLAD
jgi:hypothetical protein